MRNYIEVSKILVCCGTAAETNEKLAEKCMSSIGKGESQTSSMGGAAYFLQKAEMYRYYIPNIIKNLSSDYVDVKEDTPLEALEFSLRTHNCLKRAGIKNLKDITDKYLYELKKIRNLGPKSVEEVLSTLQQYGLTLKGFENNSNNWIPVSEQLPPKGNVYLASFDDGFVASVSYEDDWELWADSGEVVAWMPLPNPYKEDR